MMMGQQNGNGMDLILHVSLIHTTLLLIPFAPAYPQSKSLKKPLFSIFHTCQEKQKVFQNGTKKLLGVVVVEGKIEPLLSLKHILQFV